MKLKEGSLGRSPTPQHEPARLRHAPMRPHSCGLGGWLPPVAAERPGADPPRPAPMGSGTAPASFLGVVVPPVTTPA